MKILFICKYNRFRSRIAEAYFKKINKNKTIKVSSAGVIKGFLPLDPEEVKIADEFGINFAGKPRCLSMDLLNEQDKIIIVANDVPREIFSYKWYKDKVEVWPVPDSDGTDEGVKNSIRFIMRKVNGLVEEVK